MKRFTNLRLWALLASLALIVLVGYGVRQWASEDVLTSFRALEHSHEVRAKVLQLDVALSELQGAAYAVQLAPDDPRVMSAYREARAGYQPLLAELRELTSDSALQQERIGFLRARIEDRVALFDRATGQGGSQTLSDVDMATLGARSPFAEITGGLLAEEVALAEERRDQVDEHVRFANNVTIGTASLQLLLLGGLLWGAERQMRKRVVAQEETRVAVGRARLIVETVREPLALIGHDLTLLQTNQAFNDFYGMEPGEGVRLGNLVGWDDSALQQRLKDVMLQHRELWDFETSQRDSADVERRVIVNVRPIELPDSAELAALLTVSDITARKHSEEQIVELNRQLSGKIEQVTEVNRELEAFSYSVSHDLRAPLRHIAGFSDKLRSQLGDERDEKLAHYCSVITDSAQRMSRLIEDLLAYSRLGRHALRLQPVDLQSLVSEVRANLMSSVEGRQIQWRIAPLPVVVADASMLRLVWQNLFDNAIKYSAGRDPAIIEVGFRETDADREFWVRDNGAGFDMTYIDKLFGVFQRLHKASAFEGTGIGLASVRRIIARHDGRTWAEAEPDKGATVYFSLPRHETFT